MEFNQETLLKLVTKMLEHVSKEYGCSVNEKKTSGGTILFTVNLAEGLKRSNGQSVAAIITVDARQQDALSLILGNSKPINKQAHEVVDFCAEADKDIRITATRAMQRKIAAAA